MRSNKFSHTHLFISLRFNLTKEGWKKVHKIKSFAHFQVTRKLGKNHSLANEVLMIANENGQYIFDEDEAIKYTESNPLLKSDKNEIQNKKNINMRGYKNSRASTATNGKMDKRYAENTN